MAQHLGPLELVGGLWAIGDPTRKSGLSIALTPEGLEHRRRGETAPLATVEWGQFVNLGVNAAYRSWHASPAAAVANQSGHYWGRDGCSLQGNLRHPYEHWSARYTHHERRYAVGHVIVLEALFDQLSDAKSLDRLGDPQWLGSAVTELASHTSWYAPTGKRLVKATLQTIGV
ncbi:hypothetical protein ACIPY6_40515 [Streptomyces sp. NPDC090054]|uniref:hypothetical protein n=1 Tax=Streptomyces sp. NPDC090054 TaxID=3365933 RepID=UPI00381C361D